MFGLAATGCGWSKSNSIKFSSCFGFFGATIGAAGAAIEGGLTTGCFATGCFAISIFSSSCDDTEAGLIPFFMAVSGSGCVPSFTNFLLMYF